MRFRLPRRLAFGAPLTLALSLLALPSAASASTPYTAGAHGYDISWPQCPSNFPPPTDFAIVGVNNGKANTQNPCFASEVQWARQAPQGVSLYLNTNAPARNYVNSSCTRRDSACNSYQYGREAAFNALAYANAAAGDVTQYWLDVETANSWSRSTSDNAQVLRGMVEVLQAAGKHVGIYSTSYQYGRIAGTYAPGLDNWVPGVARGLDTAPAACTSAASFGGGRVVMVQWTATFDENYVCP